MYDPKLSRQQHATKCSLAISRVNVELVLTFQSLSPSSGADVMTVTITTA
jgi:hypothetical protein